MSSNSGTAAWLWRAGLSAAGAAAAATIVSAPATALPAQSWNGYHWARTGPLVIGLGDNVSSAWDSYVNKAATQWSAAPNIDFAMVAGQSPGATCTAKYGGVQVCNGNYGATGWLGYASVWTSGGFIVQATVQLNDYYFASAKYNTAAWRAMTACQEIGHTLGLAHTNEIRTNLNTGSCMDYTNDPSGKAGGSNGTLANIAPNAVDFAALAGIYAKLDSTQLSYTKPDHFLGHGFDLEGYDTEVSLSLVPEPASWTLLIAGFGLVGSAMRRRGVAAAA